jgi:hypothetical protein
MDNANAELLPPMDDVRHELIMVGKRLSKRIRNITITMFMFRLLNAMLNFSADILITLYNVHPINDKVVPVLFFLNTFAAVLLNEANLASMLASARIKSKMFASVISNISSGSPVNMELLLQARREAAELVISSDYDWSIMLGGAKLRMREAGKINNALPTFKHSDGRSNLYPIYSNPIQTPQIHMNEFPVTNVSPPSAPASSITHVNK